MSTAFSSRTWPLLAVTLLNYLAQIPYYLRQYYLPHHLGPALPGTALLLLTLMWFFVGIIKHNTGQRYGSLILGAYLGVQVLFYAHALVLGIVQGAGIVAQFANPSVFLRIIFAIGYLNAAVSAWYLFSLWRHQFTEYSKPTSMEG